MTRRLRIGIDRLVLDGLPPGTPPAAIERAVVAALRARFSGDVVPGAPATVPSVRIDGRAGSTAGAAGEVASAVAGIAGRRR